MSATIVILIFSLLLGFTWQILSGSTTSPSLIKMVFKNLHKNKSEKDFNVVLVFAHPDDEAMFFSPTLVSLKHAQQIISGIHQQNNEHSAKTGGTKDPIFHNKELKIHFVCLTRGNYDKLGEIREKEMHASATFYGVDSCTVIEDSRCQDGPKEQWDQGFITKDIVKKKIIDDLKADVVLTFDDYGVSGHKNHIDTYANVFAAAEKLRSDGKDTTTKIPKFYRLKSLPIWRKYSSIFGVIVRNAHQQLSGALSMAPEPKQDNSNNKKEELTFILPPTEGFLSMKGLWKHRSQFVWFRFFYVLLASYSYENILEEF